jgi:hypothetical protein
VLDLNQKVLNVRKEVLGERHPDTLLSMFNMMALYVRLERNQEAMALGPVVLNTQREVFGERHPRTLDTERYLTSLSEKIEQRNLMGARVTEGSLRGTQTHQRGRKRKMKDRGPGGA